MRYQSLLLLATSLTSAALMANEAPVHTAAHQHGVASLSMAIADHTIEIMLDTPVANIVGFEHAARTDEESIQSTHQTDALESVDKLFSFNEDALCTLLQTGLSRAQDEANDAHADIEVSYAGRCADIEQLSTLDAAGLFTTFPALERIEVQWLSDRKQSSAVLTPENTIISFK